MSAHVVNFNGMVVHVVHFYSEFANKLFNYYSLFQYLLPLLQQDIRGNIF